MPSILDIPEEQYEKNKKLAIEWYKQGIKPTHSQGICESTTAGYGFCDDLGYFEYPLNVEAKTNRIIIN